MTTILKTVTHVSRKDRTCDCCNIILSNYSISDLLEFPLTEDEKDTIEKAKNNNWLIKKGEVYIYQVMIYDGFQTTKSIPGIFNICIKYNLFDE